MKDGYLASIVTVNGKRGDTYKVIIRIKGHPVLKKTFKSRTAARNWAQQEEAAIRRGEEVNVPKEAQTRTVKELFDEYRANVLSLKPTSRWYRVQETYLKWWEARIGSYTIATIKPKMIEDHLAELSAAGDTRYTQNPDAKPDKPKARQTLKHYRDTLDRVFKKAVQWRWAVRNPLADVDKIPRPRNHVVRFLSPDEYKALMAACRASDNTHLYPIVLFAVTTGARQNEILNLTMEDIDLERRRARLRITKNGEPRSVRLSSDLAGLLKSHMKSMKAFYLDRPSTTQWLFPRAGGLAPANVEKAWVDARDAAGLANFRFHDLRHTFASYFAMEGGSLRQLMDALGHKSLEMVLRYAHLTEEHSDNLIDKMAAKRLSH